MEFKIRKATSSDSEFIFECLTLLLDKKMYEFNEFQKFYENCMKQEHSDLWLASVNGLSIGFLTANKFLIPRYLGFGIEVEEIVIIKKFQGRGFGRLFLETIIEYYKPDLNCRKIIIKSNDLEGSCKLYRRVFSETDFMVFQTFLNKV